MVFGLGWPEWLTIIALIGALLGTFWLMARASVAYERARLRRQGPSQGTPGNGDGPHQSD
jgi:hypothetical protein